MIDVQVSCPAGQYGSTSLLGSDTCTGPCSPGHYCLAGSTSPTQNICPPGRFGRQPALGSPECSGQCDAGYYCPDDGRSMNATRYPCGGSHVYCPHGSGAPIPVSPGFYSVGGGSDSLDVMVGAEEDHHEEVWLNGARRSHQVQCTPGTYCVMGVRRYCPEGQYGLDYGQQINTCSGQCQPGYYCPKGSTSPEQVACPAGRYGSVEGLGNSQCTNACAKGHYCPMNSTNAR